MGRKLNEAKLCWAACEKRKTHRVTFLEENNG